VYKFAFELGVDLRTNCSIKFVKCLKNSSENSPLMRITKIRSVALELYKHRKRGGLKKKTHVLMGDSYMRMIFRNVTLSLVTFYWLAGIYNEAN
jgi:hypothetical protein